MVSQEKRKKQEFYGKQNISLQLFGNAEQRGGEHPQPIFAEGRKQA